METETAHWALMWALLGASVSTIVFAVVVTAATVLGVM